MARRSAPRFFVQAAPKQPWHVESDENCERMLCGDVISVDLPTSRIRHAAPSRALACGDCWMKLRLSEQ